jgi:predicted amidohydrolase YtcJ
LAEAIGHATREGCLLLSLGAAERAAQVGPAADFVVAGTDLITASPDSLLVTKVARTVVAGRVRYSCAGSNEHREPVETASFVWQVMPDR